ncbi:hypothetical protein E0H75_18635 [Kribbella capetownensis]|uniref:Uncharacterized protein n=1 Tax=Kribbella capetownensis TaxID=1572659 RepID=A0A4R0JQ71_9ACTN|nr:hypothetical protein [Kribbella capetownensis]TCC48607.1 hypothetical protein E0H75_18635 [Kribbella capetownensis]
MANRSRRLAAWQEQVIAKAGFVRGEIERLSTAGSAREVAIGRAINDRLEHALLCVGMAEGAGEPHRRTRVRFTSRWSGAHVEGAFLSLHLAEVQLVELYTDEDISAHSPGVLARMQTCFAPTDQRRVEAESLFGRRQHSGSERAESAGQRSKRLAGRYPHRAADGPGLHSRRAAFREAMKVSYEAADEQHARLRHVRNVLVVATLLLTALVVAICLTAAAHPTAIPLCFANACPSTAGTSPDSGDVTIVALMGILGGALSATLAVQNLRTTATSTPYGIPVSLALFKLPAGALTAIGGLVLIHGEFVPGLSDLDSQGQILAYAIVLGVAQQLVTRFVDQRARSALAAVPSKVTLKRPTKADSTRDQ